MQTFIGVWRILIPPMRMLLVSGMAYSSAFALNSNIQFCDAQNIIRTCDGFSFSKFVRLIQFCFPNQKNISSRIFFFYCFSFCIVSAVLDYEDVWHMRLIMIHQKDGNGSMSYHHIWKFKIFHNLFKILFR